ncbi:MAG: DNA primase [Oscillospiraceae bacterium]|nr:DNA primase [Oscillospiraceae bacterium]
MDRNTPDWFQNNVVNEVRFCEDFLSVKPLKCVNNVFYSIDGTLSDDVVSGEIYAKLSGFVTSGIARKTDNLLKALKLHCHCEDFKVSENEIHLQNGILRTDGTFFDTKKFCVNRLNVTYNENIFRSNDRPERFLKFLSEMLDSEDIVTLQEYLGYCLIPSTKGQSALFIIGNGGEGKSCIGVVLREIFGNAMLTGNFQRVETDKFFRYNLQNKLIMLDDDMQMSALPSTGYIKNLITAKIPVDVEAKGQQSRQAEIYARFICFGNGSPKALYDKSDGFARRLIILTTKPVPLDRVPNPNITDEFISEKEKIFCWIFEGLQRLIANNFRFTVSEKAKRNVAELVSENCNIIDFLADRNYIMFGKELEATSNDLFGGYSHWCSQNGLTPMKQYSFTSWLKANSEKYRIKYDCNIISREDKRVRGFKGIRTSFTPFVT